MKSMSLNTAFLTTIVLAALLTARTPTSAQAGAAVYIPIVEKWSGDFHGRYSAAGSQVYPGGPGPDFCESMQLEKRYCASS